MSDDKDSLQTNETRVCDYLERMFQASKALIQINDDNGDAMDVEEEEEETTPSSLTPNGYIDAIAQNLVAACHPEMLSLGVSHLPVLNIFNYDENLDLLLAQENEDDGDDDDDDDDDFTAEINRDRFYQHRRSDYLRRLLRLMAPVAMEVCAVALSSVLSRSNSSSFKDSTRQSPQLAAVILLSHWLPVSPHLSTMGH